MEGIVRRLSIRNCRDAPSSVLNVVVRKDKSPACREFQDRYDDLSSHTHKGLDFCERFSNFLRERCSIEQEYAAKLKKLVKNYQPKKKEEDDYQYTSTQGFLKMLREINDLASQHEVVAETLTSSVHEQVVSLMQEVKQERRKHLREGEQLQRRLQAQLNTLESTKKTYEKSFKESERAADAYKTADDNINLSRAEVEKYRNISIQKKQMCEDCKNEYASQLQKTNEAQRLHYTQQMPQIFQNLQTMDENRGQKIQEFIKLCAKTERDVIPIINTCIDGMEVAAAEIDVAKDSQLVIEKYKSGYEPPDDIPFEDLSTGVPNNPGGGSQTSLTPKNTFRDSKGAGTKNKKAKNRGGLFGLFDRTKLVWLDFMKSTNNCLLCRKSKMNAKGDDAKEDYSHLPPNPQKKKLNQKIDHIKHNIANKTAERDGMLKMREVYENNRELGDPESINSKLDENGQTLDQLKQELIKFEGYLAEAEGRGHLKASNGQGSSESLQRSTSDLSVNSGGTAPNTPQLPTSSNHNISQVVAADEPDNASESAYYNDIPDLRNPQESPDSGVDSTARIESFNENEFDDVAAPIGSCRAAFPFEPTLEFTISMAQDEGFYVIEKDQDDGWTRVRRLDGSQEGYAPTSYIEIHWY
ncbi:cdc42-interacting protein 4 homolog isoform X2 [Tubulanus polymorphus]|uniref:cdc42-interacting protein 4 homolog isoform X2 n=1 Tax=Tubulanus polymorphus TaxID=672921 RepID=UPI003DA1D5A0